MSIMTSSLKTFLNDCCFYRRRVNVTPVFFAVALIKQSFSKLRHGGTSRDEFSQGLFSSVLIIGKFAVSNELSHYYVTVKA